MVSGAPVVGKTESAGISRYGRNVMELFNVSRHTRKAVAKFPARAKGRPAR
jgi:hypothetical protein